MEIEVYVEAFGTDANDYDITIPFFVDFESADKCQYDKLHIESTNDNEEIEICGTEDLLKVKFPLPATVSFIADDLEFHKGFILDYKIESGTCEAIYWTGEVETETTTYETAQSITQTTAPLTLSGNCLPVLHFIVP